jgi:hypothetical protein
MRGLRQIVGRLVRTFRVARFVRQVWLEKDPKQIEQCTPSARRALAYDSQLQI